MNSKGCEVWIKVGLEFSFFKNDGYFFVHTSFQL